jgi:MFS family permease
VAWAGCGLYLLNALAFTYGFSLFIEPLGREFGWSRSAISGVWSATLGFGALVAVPAGWAIDRWGSRPIALIGAPLVGLAWLLITVVSDYPTFFVVYAGVLGLGLQPALVIAGQAAVSTWFRRDRGQAFSLVSAGAGLAGLVGVPVLGWLLASGDWRLAARALGLAIIVAGIPLALLLRSRPHPDGIGPSGALQRETGPRAGREQSGLARDWTALLPAALRRQADADTSYTPAEAGATRVFWLLMIVTAARFVGMGVVTLHLVSYLQRQGFSTSAASAALGLGLAASLPGRAIFGWLADRVASRWVLALCLVFQAFSLLPVMLATGRAHLYLYAALWGMGLGSEPLIGSIRADYFGHRYFGTISGYFTWPQFVGRIAGALLGGAVYDWSGSYRIAFLVATGLFAGAALLSMRLGPPTPVSPSAAAPRDTMRVRS